MQLKLQTSYRDILGMSLPISLSMVVPQFNFITNNIFLGGLGEDELASAGITGVYYLIFAVIGNGLSNGLQVLIARRAGQNLPKEIGRLFLHGVWVALCIALGGIIITYIFVPFLFNSTLHNRVIYDHVVEFLFIRIWGLPLLYLYVMRNALLIGTNQTRLLFWGTLAEALTNIFFDYSLIYGHFGLPELGFNGAAYASILGEGAGLFVVYIIIRKQGLHKRFYFFEKIKVEFSILKKIIWQSAPLIAQYALSIIAWVYFYVLIEHHGALALAVSSTMRNIFGVFGIFIWAFAATSNTMVSNIIGQGRQEEVIPLVRRIATISFLVASFLCLILNIFPEWVLGFYGQGQEFIISGISVIRIISIALLLFSFGTVWLNAVTGTGNTIFNLVIELVTLTFYVIYVYFILEYWFLPITWGWVSEWIYWISTFLLSFYYIKSGRWKNKNV